MEIVTISALVRIEEMRQSLRIIEQCLNNMPEGIYKSRHPLTTPPMKETYHARYRNFDYTFLSVSWGPVIPQGEAFSGIEASKGNNGYYLISNGDTIPYRVRIRTPSFQIFKWYRISVVVILLPICYQFLVV